MPSILQKIRKKRADHLELGAIESKNIKNYIVCIRPKNDKIAERFCTSVKALFRKAHPIYFHAPYSCSFVDAISAAVTAAATEKDGNFVDAPKWHTVCIAVLSDTKEALEAAKEVSDQSAENLLIVYIGTQKPESSDFLESLVWIPSAASNDPEAFAEIVRAFCVWMLNTIQGHYLRPRKDNNEVHRNCLTGCIYDCIEQRMRCETAENLANLLCASPDEREKFLKKIYECIKNPGSDALNGRPVDTLGYESLASKMKLCFPSNFFKRLLCKLSKSYKEANCEWRTEAISCKKAVDLLYGEHCLEEITDGEFFIAAGAFEQWWQNNKKNVLQTTLKILTEATRPNGILDNELDRMSKEGSAALKKLQEEENKVFKPQGPKLKQMQNALRGIDQLIQTLENLKLYDLWIRYVKEKICKVVEDEKIKDKQQDYELWKTQLGGAAERTTAKYNWDEDPVPSVPTAYLTDVDDDRFDVDAGMQWIRNKLGGRTGAKLLCASQRYESENWESPSKRKNSIDNVEHDSFIWLEGISESELVLLCMDSH